MDDPDNSSMAALSFDPTRVLVIAGPTSSGKSSLALSLAEEAQGELVCMDSMQVYREMQVGTSRPATKELTQVPHHLYGDFSIEKPISGAAYVSRASSIITDIQTRGKLPILVGGTGLYMKALFEGLDDLPATPNALRMRLETLSKRHGLSWLYRMLQRLDPKGAAHLHPNDQQRIQRFLEVRILTHQSMLDLWNKRPANPKPPVAIGLRVERPLLVKRISDSVSRMLKSGWIEETQALKKQGLTSALQKVGPLGYSQVLEYLAGNINYEKMEETVAVITRRYAKRQMTWFRKVDYIQWFPFDPVSGYNVKQIKAFMKERFD